MYRKLSAFRNTILPAILNSYSVVFFCNSTFFALVLMAVSFFNLFAGLSGLIATVAAVLIAHSMGFDKIQLKKGLFTFNALLTGIGMGTFFDPSMVFFSLLLLAALLSLLLSVTLAAWLGKYGLPFLSIPFVVTFWFIVLPSAQFENLGLTQRNIYWINELYAMGGNSMLNFFQTINALPINRMVDIYLRAMGSIFFQDNLIAGLLIATALLIHSRIAFSLSVIGFLSAFLFAHFTGSIAGSITYYNIGANYVMVAIAMGGFFLIPSKRSYLWAILLVPLTSLILLFMTKLLGFIQLQVFSLPFSMVVILFLYFLQLRVHPSKLQLTTLQYYSPEINLYTFKNNKERLSNLLYLPFHLPFWGQWSVSQGHNGAHTHKGEWGHAFDFMLRDEFKKTHSGNGLLCQEFYCYNKPVLAPANGTVEEIIDHIDDNEIGKVNTTNNWGNTIIIRHLPGLYSQLSHLKKDSFKVAKGDTVKQGDLIALCGNSGRSPEPHLHFQIQSTPTLGARTLDYPLAYFHKKDGLGNELRQFERPAQEDEISGTIPNKQITSAFDIQPNSNLRFSYTTNDGAPCIELWESYTDAYNNRYLYCQESASIAYYVNDGSMFYFTSFDGNKSSLLYFFYLSAYKVFLGELNGESLTDAMPLNIVDNKRLAIWLHDFVAPFYDYIRVNYSIKQNAANEPFNADTVTLSSRVGISIFGKTESRSSATLRLHDNAIQGFSFESKTVKIEALCIR